MPKKKSSRPNSSLGSNQRPEPKTPTQLRRERTIRIASIVIVLALLLSVLAGAFSITPSQAAEPGLRSAAVSGAEKSVQISNADVTPVGDQVDTDGDGIPNNEDPDIDGDGIVNANDGDIDGDGVSNFDDGDPAATNGIDGKTPNKPGSISFKNLTDSGAIFWLLGAAVLATFFAGLFWRKTAKNRGKIARKNI